MSFPRRKLLLGVCAAATVLIPALRTTVLSFALALFLAGCLQRPMIRLQRRGVPRVISAPAFLLLGLVPLIAMLAGGIFYGLRGVQQLAAPTAGDPPRRRRLALQTHHRSAALGAGCLFRHAG